MIKLGCRFNSVTINRSIKEIGARERFTVSLDLITESLEAMLLTSIANLLDEDANLGSVVNGTHNKIGLNGNLLVLGNIFGIEVRDLVNLRDFTDCAKEIIARDSLERLEETKPEYLSGLSVKSVADLLGQVVVNDVFKVNLVKIIGPRMQNREALVLDFLRAVLFNVLSDKFKTGLVGRDRVVKIVIVNLLVRVTDEGTNGLDARRTLHVLEVDVVLEKFSDFVELSNTDHVEYTGKNLLETLQVPVLVDTGVDNLGVEHLLGFVGKQVQKTVELVQSFSIVFLVFAELRE